MANQGEKRLHPDPGLIQSFLDGELEEGEERDVHFHLEGCADCRARAEVLTRAADTVGRGLALLDTDPELGAARDRLRFRRAGRPGKDTLLPWHRRSSLPRAASIALLLTGAAATALPGSPVRSWLGDRWDALVGSPTATGPASEVPGTAVDVVEAYPLGGPETGITLPAGEAGVELWIRDLPPEATIRVVWVEEGQAGIFAGEGTRYRRQDSRLEAQAPPGSVRVELPRSLVGAVVGVDGAVLLRLTAEGVELTRPARRSSDTEILFGPTGAGTP